MSDSAILAPHNHDVEMALLSCLLTDPRSLDRIDLPLDGTHFADDRLGKLYDACCAVIGRGEAADPFTLKGFMGGEDFKDLGGGGFLGKLLSMPAPVAGARDYARTVLSYWQRREAVTIANALTERANADHDPVIGVDDILLEAVERIEGVRGVQPDQSGPVSMSQAMTEALENAEAAAKGDTLTTGLADLDRKLVTFRGERLIVLAGRPSMGKTSLATDIAFHVARNHGPVGFFSLEMSAAELSGRILAGETGIDSWKIEQGKLDQGQWGALLDTKSRIQSTPLHIDDTAALDPQRMLERARKLRKKAGGLALIVVDYLQLIDMPRGRKSDNRVQEISYITRELKRLAKEMDCPVLALSQLSRAVESRTPPRPQLSDLRDSGTIEQDADAVMFVYRPEYYLKRDAVEPTDADHGEWLTQCQNAAGKAEVIVEKQRGGAAPATVLLHFNERRTRFTNYIDRMGE